MPDFITPTTELEAVNAILASVGESPVDALDGDFVDAEIARNLLTQECRAAQTEGYTFNTEADYPLAPDVHGRIFLPQNTLQFLFEDTSLVQRGNRVYGREGIRIDARQRASGNPYPQSPGGGTAAAAISADAVCAASRAAKRLPAAAGALLSAASAVRPAAAACPASLSPGAA